MHVAMVQKYLKNISRTKFQDIKFLILKLGKKFANVN